MLFWELSNLLGLMLKSIYLNSLYINFKEFLTDNKVQEQEIFCYIYFGKYTSSKIFSNWSYLLQVGKAELLFLLQWPFKR
jgi:hypothetical protein